MPQEACTRSPILQVAHGSSKLPPTTLFLHHHPCQSSDPTSVLSLRKIAYPKIFAAATRISSRNPITRHHRPRLPAQGGSLTSDDPPGEAASGNLGAWAHAPLSFSPDLILHGPVHRAASPSPVNSAMLTSFSLICLWAYLCSDFGNMFFYDFSPFIRHFSV